MTVVEIRSRRPEDGSIELIGSVSVPEAGGPAVAVGVDTKAQAYLEHLLVAGVPGADGQMLSGADGERFVAALPDALRGSRLWAIRVPRARVP